MERHWSRFRWAVFGAPIVLLAGVLSLPFMAFKVKEGRKGLDALSFSAPRLRVTKVLDSAEALRDRISFGPELDRYRAEHGIEWRFVVDQRTGRVDLAEGGAIPFLPGPANRLRWKDFSTSCDEYACLSPEVAEGLARQFLEEHRSVFRVDPSDLVAIPDGTGPAGNSIYFVRFQWTHRGIPVEGATVGLIINNGNLIVVGMSRIGPIDVDPRPDISADTAWEILKGYLAGDWSEKDQVLDAGSLAIVPVTPAGADPNVFRGALGSGLHYSLTWRLVFRRPGVVGTWEALVDAHTGEILRFVDRNRYGKIQGGVYPSDGRPPEGTRPFAFADTGLASPNDYSDAGGNFPGNNATTTLTGKYAHLQDDCGSISATTATGDINFGMSGGTDCAVPSPNLGGAGNTHAARTLYYHSTEINKKARFYLPGVSWLNTNFITCHVNQPAYCNASSGGGVINFYQASSPCTNLGEVPGVALHEWAHSLDEHDGSGTDADNIPVETRADFSAILQTHDSCTGRGAFTDGNCGGYGDSCTDCTGIRDADYTKHANSTPWTPQNMGTFFDCSGDSYYGPCGGGDHCESGISTQAMWEMVNTDLPAQCGMDVTSAWQLIDRLWYTMMPQALDMYTCTVGSPTTSDGCGSGSLWTLLRAMDDDGDGPANGTPHAHGIYTALARHNIACNASGDPSNANQTTCPTLTAPTLSATAGSNSAILSWTSVTNATRYFVLRNDTGCSAGFTVIATVNAPALTYTDTGGTNGLTSYYMVQAATAKDQCTSPLSNCAPVTPQPCAGSVSLDRSLYNCSDTVAVSVLDSTPGSSPWAAEAWSTADGTHKTVALANDPPGSAIYTGSFATTSGAAGPTEVQVADGATITVQFTDPDYCGAGSHAVTSTAATDCVGPSISNVQAINVTGMSADITWDTNEGSDSTVIYENLTPPAAHSASSPAVVTSHVVHLSGLTECTKYYYYVNSADPAGNMASDDDGGAYYTFVTGKNNSPTYGKTETPPLAIPDNDPTGGASSVLAVADDKAIQDVNVTVNISHTYDGDLTLTLIGPDATSVTLSNRRGGGGNNFTGTVFDDAASTPIASGTAPFTGSFQPDSPLSAFDGKTAAGDWTLKAVDWAGTDTGAIDSWDLTFTFPAETCPTSDGWIQIEQAIYGCSSSMNVTMQDVDLLGAGTHAVEFFSTTEATPESVTLTETPASSGVFKGTFPTTAAAAAHGDNLLSVSSGDTITARYTDADDGQGHTNVAKTDSAAADCSGPVISNVQVTSITPSGATITWETDKNANSRVTYGTSIPPGTNKDDLAAYGTSHSVVLTGVTECTKVYFSVTSADIYDNTATDTNGGAYYAFTTTRSSGPTSFTKTESPPLGIPDDNPTGASSVLAVADSKTILDVNVAVNITHAYDGDLVLYLIGPDATQVTLCNRRGGSGDNFASTVFDDEATAPIAGGTAPFTGSFQPESPLGAFDGKNSAGNWTLKAEDADAYITGTIDGWTLSLTFPSGACPTPDGWIQIESATYGCSSAMNLTIQDVDLQGAGTHGVEMSSTTEASPEIVTLAESPAGSGVFVGTFGTTAAPPVHGDGLLSVSHGDTITATYVDADDGQGHTNLAKTDTATVDCSPPVISNVKVNAITTDSAQITWTTDKAANSRVTYGASTPPGTSEDDLANFVTDHTIDLTGLSMCTSHFFSVTSADIFNNSASDTNGGAYYTFKTLGRTFALGPDDVEGGTGPWTASGGSTSIWHIDTCRASSGTHSWKAGQSDAPTCTAKYGDGIDTYLTSSTFRLGSTGHGYRLRWNEWYSTESCCDKLTPQISTNGGTSWTNLATAYGGASSGWVSQNFDLAAYTGNNVRIRFLFHTDASVTSEGWFLDDIEVSKPTICEPHAAYSSHALVQDTCPSGGPGSGDGTWDNGEQVQFVVTIANDGTNPLTGITATVTPATPGLTMIDGTADYDDLPAGSEGASHAPHFTARLPPGLACGDPVTFHLAVNTAEGSWSSDFSQVVGHVVAGGAQTVLGENFNSVTPPALPGGWTYGHASGNDWTTSASYTCSAPNSLLYPFHSSEPADSWAYTPAIALTAGVTYTLNFNQRTASSYFTENLEVKAGASPTPAGQTIAIWSQTGLANTTCTMRSPTFTVPATGAYYIGWHCTSAADMWNLIVDDINLTYEQAASCTMNQCGPNIAYDDSFNPLTTMSQLCGDGDSTVEPGEKWQVTVRLKNTGSQGATSVAGTLTLNAGSQAAATITGNPGSYGAIGAGGTATANYQFLADPSIVCNENLVFDVTGIQSSEGTYASKEPAFTVPVGGNAPERDETATQVTPPPLSATSNSATANLLVDPGDTPFTIASADEATLSYAGDYTAGSGTEAIRFGPDTMADLSNWNAVGYTYRGNSTSCSHGNNFARSDNSAGTYTLTQGTSISTIGYSTVTVHMDWGLSASGGATQYLDWSTNGTDWTMGAASTTYNGWECNQVVILAGAECKDVLWIRFRTVATTNTRGQVDYVSITGVPVRTWLANAKVELLGPGAHAWTLKNYCAASDTGSYDVLSHYNEAGPGTYQIRLSENVGGTATITGGSMNVVQNATTNCTVAVCAAPPETAPGTTIGTALSWSDASTATWPENSQATSYAVYRGLPADLPKLISGLQNSCAKCTGNDTHCTANDDPSGVPGRFYWYLVTGANGIGEGTAGNASASTCGTPPCERTINSSGNCP